jgi:hypothetical protein
MRSGPRTSGIRRDPPLRIAAACEGINLDLRTQRCASVA